jgi:hypothetical protein
MDIRTLEDGFRFSSVGTTVIGEHATKFSELWQLYAGPGQLFLQSGSIAFK